MVEERFEFTAGAKKKIFGTIIAGIVLLILGIIMVATGGHGGDHADDAHHAFHWTHRLYANLWINNVYFTGLAIMGVFFVAINYVSQAGWSASIMRIPLALGNWLPIAGLLMLVVFFIGGHDIFHWTHDYLYDKNDARYDEIIANKQSYLNTFFFVARMIVYFAIWYLLFVMIKKTALKEDELGGDASWRKNIKLSAIFLVFFAVSSSMSAWDWVMSIDTHWFSTMFGWYVFASWFVSALAFVTLVVVILKDNGYLSIVNNNHLHDLGKFIFAFSIFWTYIWFSQFLLIYYANIPEESVYFVERLQSDHYAPYFFFNLIINFFFPFLILMTRDSKRQVIFLKIAAIAVLIGHWFDFFLMVTPGTLSENGGFGFLEIGVTLIYLGAFLLVVLTHLSKSNLIPKNHPMLEESIHHNI